MNQMICVLACVLAGAHLLAAQEDAKAPSFEMPDPKRPEHATLATLAGDWEFTMRMEAMPGVPGMEEAVTATGIERAELVCNGLWLKSSIDSTFKGAPFQGIWLAGYDPFKKKYSSYWVSSDTQECGLSIMDGTYEAATKTWNWAGATPQGEMRSVYVMKGADESTETCYAKTPDGKEVKCMEIVRKRTSGARPVPAGKTPVKLTETSVPAELAILHKDLGEWDATVKTSPPGMPPGEDQGTETVKAVCGGRWTWSDFRGRMMGVPFEGHALAGYDPKEKKYVSLWIDSLSATAVRTSGCFDPVKKTYALGGQGLCPLGKDVKVSENISWKGDDERVAEFVFESDGQKSQMRINYRRRTNR
jgi:hypothetical protein